MSDEMDRFFNLLQDQNRVLVEQGKILARIEEAQENSHERLFGGPGQPGALHELNVIVATHTRQINFWKGGIAVLTFLWGVVLAWGGVIISKRR